MIRLFKAAVRGVKAEYFGGVTSQGLLGSSPWAMSRSASIAGKSVSAETSLGHSAAWACIRKTSEMISSLPLDHFRKSGDGKRVRLNDDLAEIIKESPNREQTAPEYWEGKVAQTMMQGNAYSEKLFIGSRLVGLRPLLNCRAERKRDGQLKYTIYDRGQKTEMPADKIFHLRGFGAGDGLGMSTIRYGANSIGAAIAADETASRVFSNSAMPSGIVYSDQTLTPDQRDQLRSMLDTYTGSEKAGKVMALEAGLKFQQLQMNPEDAQLLETRRYGIEEICRWFGVPPIVIGHAADGQSMWGSGVEAILLSWLTMGVNPFLVRIEKRIRKDLLSPAVRRKEYFEYNREAMIQMDSKAKGDLMLKLRMGGFISGDEGRDKINLEPRGGQSDELWIQSSMTPVANSGETTK